MEKVTVATAYVACVVMGLLMILLITNTVVEIELRPFTILP
jgi:hypothetical protein